MCTSGCGTSVAILLRRRNSASLSATGCWFQNTSPSLLTEISMFSGLVCRAMLVSFGRLTGIVCVTTGIVMRKMMSSTSITSTSGVVLIEETTSSSSLLLEPTFIAMGRAPGRSSTSCRRAHARAHQDAVQVGAEAANGFHGHLVATDQPVVAEHRWNGDEETERGHDQCLADRASHLVDRSLTGDADGRQRVVDAPDRSEQADEGGCRADRGEECQAVLQAALNIVQAALNVHRNPGVVVDVLGQGALVVLARFQAAVGDEAECGACLQRLGRLCDALRLAETLLRRLRLARELETLVQLGHQDVPASHAHQRQDDERAAGDVIALRPEGVQSVRVIDGFLGCRRHGHGCRRDGGRRVRGCLLYTSDAADEEDSVDL